jgi:hypothetical protein
MWLGASSVLLSIAPRKGEEMAIAAMVLGIMGLVLCWVPVLGPLLALAALILGIVSLVRKNPRRGLALTGLIMGGVGVLLGLIVSVVILSGFNLRLGSGVDSATESDARLGACAMGSAVRTYAARNPGRCPTMAELTEGLSGPSLRDPWGNDYIIDCSGDEPEAYSRGPDGTGEPIRCEESFF